LVLGKHSGRHAVKKRLAALGIKLARDDFEQAFVRFKELADKKKEIFDEDLEIIAMSEIRRGTLTYQLCYLHAIGGSVTVPTATVRLKIEGEERQEAACGDGPVDAAYNAVDRLTGLKPRIEEYKLKAVTRGRDALGEVYVSLCIGKVKLVGRGSSTDIIEASLLAYLDAMNRYRAEEGKKI
jgi:2-isopropylmalate synthase